MAHDILPGADIVEGEFVGRHSDNVAVFLMQLQDVKWERAFVEFVAEA